MEINVFSNYTLLLGSLSFALLPTTFILDLEKKKGTFTSLDFIIKLILA